MSHRFYVEDRIEQDAQVVLAGSEAHHLLHVMRLGVGDDVTLFDGSGDEFTAVVASTTRRDVTLAEVNRQGVDREPNVGLTVGVALPKGDRQRVLVEKLTELGVAQLVPIVTERSVALPKGGGLDKLRRAVIETSKQCGRNRLMKIAQPAPLADFLEAEHRGCRWIAHPEGGLWQGLPASAEEATVAIGPEGGFTDDEYQAALAAGWEGIGLGDRILRIETAAIGLAFAITSAAQP